MSFGIRRAFLWNEVIHELIFATIKSRTKLYCGSVDEGDSFARGTAALVFGICEQQMMWQRFCALTLNTITTARTHRL